MNTKYTIYWTLGGYPGSQELHDLNKALKVMEEMRRSPAYSAIAMASECVDQVGKMGVDSIENGILPDGYVYEYMKRREQ